MRPAVFSRSRVGRCVRFHPRHFRPVQSRV